MKKNTAKIIAIVVAVLLIIAGVIAIAVISSKKAPQPNSTPAGQSGAAGEDNSQQQSEQLQQQSVAAQSNNSREDMEKIMVEITMKNGGKMLLELDPEAAPLTVENFVKLVEEEFYDGLIFHRVIEDFMIQGGCPDGTGMGGPGYGLKGEFASNGWDNPIKHERGVISMARSQDPDSAGSQFFIVHNKASHLDGGYAAFGRLVEGLDVLDAIATTPTGAADRPVEDQVIETIRIVDSGETQE